VVIVSSGRPQTVNFAEKHARAIVNLWYLGENGGSALADVLFGDYNPAGRLPITVPRSVGQIPFNFPFKPGAHGRDEGQVSGPLYAFGHGLSYTRFEYSGLAVSPARIKPSGKVTVSLNVRNAGKLAGDEVVQLYVRDDYGSVTTFERSLRGFERIQLAAGQTRRVAFTLGPEELALYDDSRRWTVEPGRFTVLVGASSVAIRQRGTFSVEAPDGSVPEEAPLAPEIVP
jgi:beta-glucosidase